MGKTGTPAWMVCVDILNKAKRELVTQAIETLEAEIDAKRMDIKGSLINVPDQPSDAEMKLFVVGQILDNAEQMRQRYGDYIKAVHSMGSSAKSADVEGAERARLFLMAVEKIETLIRYSKELDSWINDASMEVGIRDPALILKRTSASPRRKELINFLSKNKKMQKEGTFSGEEIRVINSASSGGLEG
ncbi:MAG: hypothetical protein KGH94_02495 [Candidatus Micrarchaeota archaeon]|nr:hypothetical protein [Candidatus Micrarchaeota archaeon]